MKKLVIKKLQKTEIEVLKYHIQTLYENLTAFVIKPNSDSFPSNMIRMENYEILYRLLRNKIDNDRKFYNINLTVTQSVILLEIVKSKGYNVRGLDVSNNFIEFDSCKTEYQKHVLLKISNTLDQQIKSLL